MGQQLGWYIEDTRAILTDRLGMFTSRRQLIRWINEARKKVAEISGCLQILVPGTAPIGSISNPGTGSPGGMIPGADPGADSSTGFFTIQGVEKYPYKFANSYLKDYNAGVDMVIDVSQVAISWSGSMRPALDYYSFDDFQAYLRSYSNMLSSYPAIWTTLGDGETGNVLLYPPPSTATEMEWLTICSPLDIYTDDDYDAIPSPFTNAVKYWAAALAYLSSQRWVQADGMEAAFFSNLGLDRASVDRGKTARYYITAP